MTYDENRISDRIDGGIRFQEEIYKKASEIFENMFLCMPSNAIISYNDHREMAKKCAKLAALVGKHNTKNEFYWDEVIKAINKI